MIGERVHAPWSGAAKLPAPAVYVCGYCDAGVTSDLGMQAGSGQVITVCPECGQPTYHCGRLQIPGVRPGEHVLGADTVLTDLYEQARSALGAGAPAAAIALCRLIAAGTARPASIEDATDALTDSARRMTRKKGRLP